MHWGSHVRVYYPFIRVRISAFNIFGKRPCNADYIDVITRQKFHYHTLACGFWLAMLYMGRYTG